MAKKPRVHIDDTDIPKEIMDAARERAIRKKADILAQREVGIAEDDGDVVKGPAPMKGEKKYTITLDLSPVGGFSPQLGPMGGLRIDDVIYHNGATYTVGERLYNTMREMIHRGWEHQREIDGKDRNTYRQQSNVHLTANDA